MDKTAEIAAPRDRTGRTIMVGDVLKVFHFTGARRKRHFMFKQVVGVRTWPSGFTAFLVSHLNMKDPAGPDGGYYLGHDGKVLEDTEIVQGMADWHEDRPRAILQEQSNAD